MLYIKNLVQKNFYNAKLVLLLPAIIILFIITYQNLHNQMDRAEKVFSLFNPFTEWISKGKAGVPVELGVNCNYLLTPYCNELLPPLNT
jgi:hypothetical protein